MGIVKRQGIKQSVVTYVGMVIGAFNLLYLYPLAFSEEQIGIIRFVLSSAVLVSPFLFWGGAEMIVRFFPRFKDGSNGHNGFLFFTFIIFGIGISTLASLFFIFKGTLMTYYEGKSPLFNALGFVFPIVLLLTAAAIFSTFSSNFQRTVVPSILNELLPKIGMCILATSFLFNWIYFDGIFWGQLVLYVLILAGQIWYVAALGQLHLRPNFSFLKKPLLKEISTYSFFGLIGSLGSRIGEGINTIMLGTMASLTDTGIYGVAFFLSDAIDTPRRAISRISSPLISEKMNSGKLGEIKEIYQKSALNQLIVGLGLLLAVWVGVDEIFELMPNGAAYAGGKYVILILGLARVFDMLTGVNTEIIGYSGFYRYNFYFILLLAFLSIWLNQVFIPKFGVNGAALSTLVSLSVYNLLKFSLIWGKLRMQPLTWPVAGVLAAGGLGYIAAAWIPDFGHPFLGLALKSSLATLVFGGIVIFFRLSLDINEILASIWKKTGLN